MLNRNKLQEYLDEIVALPFVNDVFLEGTSELFDGQDRQSYGSLIIKINQKPNRFKFILSNFTKYSTVNNLINNLDLDGIYRDLFGLSKELLRSAGREDAEKASLLISLSKAIKTPLEGLIG